MAGAVVGYAVSSFFTAELGAAIAIGVGDALFMNTAVGLITADAVGWGVSGAIGMVAGAKLTNGQLHQDRAAREHS